MAALEILGIRLEVDDQQLSRLQEKLKETGGAVHQLGVESNAAEPGIIRLGAAHEEAGRKSEEHGHKEKSAHDIIGASKSQTRELEQALVGLAGAEGIAGQAAGALASGLGPVGIATVAATVALAEYTKWVEAAGKAEADRAERNTFVGVMGRAAEATFNTQTQVKYLNESIKKLSEDIAVIDSGRLSYIEAAALAGEGGIEGLRKKLVELTKQRDELTSKGYVSPEQIGGLLEFTTEAHGAAQAVEMLIDAELRASAIGGKSSSPRLFGTDQFEKGVTDYKAYSEEIQKEATARNAKLAALDTQRISEAKREADAEAAFQREIADASSVASAEIQANFQQIANSALTASEKTQVLHMYLSRLPEHIRTQIQIAIQTHADALLMRLLGAGGSKGGHQQGNQWDFTFEGEDPATRAAFLAANNNDVDAARAAWYAQHAAELTAQGIDKPDNYQSPYTPAGTQMASGGIVTRPTRALIGEAGDEAVIPLDRFNGIGQGATVNLYFTNNVYGISTAQEEEVRPMILPMLERAIYEINQRK